MSLADELLADLEEGGGEDLEDQIQAELMEGGAEIQEIEEIEAMEEEGAGGSSGEAAIYERVTHVARLIGSDRYKNIMARIDVGLKSPRKSAMVGPVEADPEYQLIVQANALSSDIDNEINVIHKFVRDKYGKRFPELESLVPMAIDYIRCVQELGNDILEKVKNNETLQNILLPATVIVVSVTASTTQGESLTASELDIVNEACEVALELNEAKLKLFDYVEGQMTFIAPNLSALVGSNAAAKLIGVAGGLHQLSKMPACNILVLGAQKKTLSGFSTTAILPHTGFIYYSYLVQSMPPDLRRKAARLVSGKCTLAARVDGMHASPDGATGRKLLTDVQQKFEKLVDPPNVKAVKALPKPIDVSSKKRGGRRVRKMKERLGLTDMRRKANRMNFAELEEDVLQDDLGFTLGQLKTSSGGRIRGPQVDDKTRARLSKTLQKTLAKQPGFGGASTVRKHGGVVSGTASSVAFTPVQGLEIVNPNAREKQQLDGTKTNYFSSTASFVKMTPILESRK